MVSQIARGTLGGRSVLYYAVQAATMAILVLAANTAYADFPRLASIVARDGFLPRQFMNQGDRLAFSNGIVILSVVAALLLVVFGGDTHALIPLYMIGVFVSFTLSQAGMVVHWRRLRTAGWRTSAAINGFGAGRDRRRPGHRGRHQGGRGRLDHHADDSGARVRLRVHAAPLRSRGGRADARGWSAGNRGRARRAGADRRYSARSRQGVAVRKTLSTDVRAVFVEIDPVATERCGSNGPSGGKGVELVVLESPYRSLMEPLLEYIEHTQQTDPTGYVTVILPEFVPHRVWHHVLHNQHALLIKGALLFKPNVDRDERAFPPGAPRTPGRRRGPGG